MFDIPLTALAMLDVILVGFLFGLGFGLAQKLLSLI